MRPILAMLAILLAPALPAFAAPPNTPDLPALIHADRWDEATALAATDPDPLIAKLVTYFRVMAPGAARFDEIVQFQAQSPDWPLQYSINRRRDEALAALPDDTEAAAGCDRFPPVLPGAVLRCAIAEAHLGRTADAARHANLAWASGEKFIEGALLKQFGAALTPRSEMQRFGHLLGTDPGAAARQLQRLAPADRPRANVLLALRHDTPNALNLLGALNDEQRQEPELVLEQARYLRRANRDDEALALWLASGFAAERASNERAAFWDERNRLARRRLAQGDNDGAYALAADTAQTEVEPAADAAFLAGFIALRKLDQPVIATSHFRRLAGLSHAAITQARAHYWLGRALGASGGGKAEYELAAAFPNTFYGQLALIELGRDPFATIRAAQLAPPDAERVMALANREVGRAAAILIAWGENRRAIPFLFRLDDIAPEAADRKLVARLAIGLGAPDIAIALARRAGRDGVLELETGWPEAAAIPPDIGLDPALALGIIRQESSFDGSTVSPVGARGLMQLMPDTARLVGKQLGTRVAIPELTTNASLNIRLGATYLRGLMDQFDATVPFAVAAYNAGPGRVAGWLATYGDPRTSSVDVLDWIEEIPFGETRNYVQLVIENEVVYAAHGAGAALHPLARFIGKGT
jgi:soluble lytic murein transglycosylase